MSKIQRPVIGLQKSRFSGAAQPVTAKHKAVMSHARQVIEKCAKIKSTVTSKRSTTVSGATEEYEEWVCFWRQQTPDDIRTKITQHYEVLDPKILNTVPEGTIVAEMFARPGIRKDFSVSHLSQASGVEVVKMGHSIHLSRMVCLKDSQLVPSGEIDPRDSQASLRRPQSTQRYRSGTFLVRKREEGAIKFERERSSMLQKMSDMSGFVECSSMGTFSKKAFRAKMNSLKRGVDEHFAQLRSFHPASLHKSSLIKSEEIF
jgi:hypothetical protein